MEEKKTESANPPITLGKSLDMLSKRVRNISLTSVLVVALIAGAYYVGTLRAENTYLKENGGGNRVAAGVAALPAVAGETIDDSHGGTQPAGDVPEVSSEDHIRGSLDAKVFLIEYSDLECPFCQRFHPTVEQVLDEYGDDVAWVYRHFPLNSIHPNAQRAAEASECVAQLGGNDAFWQFVDDVFAQSGPDLSVDGLADFAAGAGVDTASFASCLESESTKDLVDQDASDAQSAGATGTPSTFIVSASGDSRLIPGALPFAQVQQAVDEALSN